MTLTETARSTRPMWTTWSTTSSARIMATQPCLTGWTMPTSKFCWTTGKCATVGGPAPISTVTGSPITAISNCCWTTGTRREPDWGLRAVSGDVAASPTADTAKAAVVTAGVASTTVVASVPAAIPASAGLSSVVISPLATVQSAAVVPAAITPAATATVAPPVSSTDSTAGDQSSTGLTDPLTSSLQTSSSVLPKAL